MDNSTIYLNESNQGFLICGKCGKSKQMNFNTGVIPRSGLAKCKCGNIIGILFERRQYYRKQLNIKGICYPIEGIAEKIPITIQNISRDGIQFIAPAGKAVRLNEKMRLTFTLGEDIVNSTISVCNIDDARIGANFITIDERGKKLLGFFMWP